MRAPIVLLAVLVLVTSSQIAHAASISTWSVNIDLLEDGSAQWTVDVVYKEGINRADYWVLGDVTDLRAAVDGVDVKCTISKAEVGSSITCTNVNGSAVHFEFSTSSATSKTGDFLTFSHNFPIAGLIDHFLLKISLPRGAVLASPERLQGTGLTPFSPSYGKQGTDGQHIFVTWELHNPKLGENIDAKVLYETVFITSAFPFIVAIAAIIAVAAIFGIYVYRFKRRPEHLLPALDPGERSVMEVVIKHKSVNQRDVVRATGFSKAKVSRVVQTLEDRRLIEALPKGRTREIRLLEQKPIESGLRSRLMKLRVKQRADEMWLDRAQAIELVQTTITPLMEWFDRIVERAHKRKFGYSWSGNEYNLDDDWERPVKNELWLKDMEKLLPGFNDKLSAFDAQLSKLHKSAERLSSAIERCNAYKSLVTKLARRYGLSGSDIPFLIRHVIDMDKIISSSTYPYAEFWNNNATSLIRTSECAPTAKARAELEQNAAMLARLAQKSRAELESVREQLRKRYHILYREYRK